MLFGKACLRNAEPRRWPTETPRVCIHHFNFLQCSIYYFNILYMICPSFFHPSIAFFAFADDSLPAGRIPQRCNCQQDADLANPRSSTANLTHTLSPLSTCRDALMPMLCFLSDCYAIERSFFYIFPPLETESQSNVDVKVSVVEPRFPTEFIPSNLLHFFISAHKLLLHAPTNPRTEELFTTS